MSTYKGITSIKEPVATSLTILLTLILLFSIVAPALAQQNRISSTMNHSSAASQPQGPTDRAELEAFTDGLLKKQMEEYHIAGAAIAVVKDGKLFFTKGYGYADVENKIPVDPKQTIFRTGSVGKNFTWTAVMQLVEQGKLDLNADVNTYLDFRVPDTYPQPITLKHLMTHTSGIEDRWLESVTSNESELVPAREWLVANFPGRVRAPGEAAGYSNYNAMLAGYIVARVSGEPYEQYVQEHIFTPLGMTHSSAYSPLPADLRQFASASYTYSDGAYHAFPDYLAQQAVIPSGFHQTSVTDMARFMIARLGDGSYGDASTEMRILEESTAQKMLTTLFTPDPRLRGTAYGLFDFSDNGQWILGHEGKAPVMHSVLLFLPDQHLGVYVVYNSDGAGEGGLTIQHIGFEREFVDHYYPAAAGAPLQPQAGSAQQVERFAGLYRVTDSHSTTPEKVLNLFGASEVSAPGDGTLVATIEGQQLRFVEVEPLYFHQVDGPFSMVFREDKQGHITYMFTDMVPEWGYTKLDWYETPTFNMVLLQVCLLILLSMLPIAVVRAIRSRRASDDKKSATRAARAAEWIAFGICLLNLLFVIGVALKFPPTQPSELHGIVLTTRLALGLGVLFAALTPVAVVFTILAWKDRYWGVAFRIYYTLVTIAALAFVWFLNYWNWLGWRY